jgi:histidine triad (HIT) family protein
MSMRETESCVFCQIARGESTPGVLAFRDSQTAVFASRLQQPRNLGHMLVVPSKHVTQIYDLNGDIAGPLMMTLARVAAAVKKAFASDGVSLRQNNEERAGQDVFHVHFHVVPRFADDGFVSLDRSLGAIELTIEQRVEQPRKVAEALTHPRAMD